METIELLRVLELVSPALSTKDFIPMFKDFFFDGKSMSAFNGKFGVSVPLQTEFVGSVRGEVFNKFASHARSREVELSVDGTNLVVKAGVSFLEIPCLVGATPPIKNFAQDDEQLLEFDCSDEILNGIKRCLECTVDDPALGERMGILFKLDQDGWRFYSTDRKSLSFYSLSKKKGTLEEGVYFSVTCEFASQWLRIASKIDMKTPLVRVTPTSIQVLFGDDCLLTGAVKIISKATIDSFERVLSMNIKWKDEDLLTVPSGLSYALMRAAAVVDPKDKTITQCSTNGPRLEFYTKTAYGIVEDKVKFERDLEKLSFNLDTSMLKRILTDDSKLELSNNNAIIIKEGHFTHIVGITPIQPK